MGQFVFLKRNLKVLFTLVLLVFPFTAALAATLIHGGGGQASFALPIEITQNQSPSFGLVTAGPASRVLRLNTSGVISGNGASSYIQGAVVGDYTISASSTRTIDITVNGYTANNGVTPSAARCRYNGGAEGTCNSHAGVTGVPAGATLLLGLTITTNATHVDGQVATPSFNLNVNYN